MDVLSGVEEEAEGEEYIDQAVLCTWLCPDLPKLSV